MSFSILESVGWCVQAVENARERANKAAQISTLNLLYTVAPRDTEGFGKSAHSMVVEDADYDHWKKCQLYSVRRPPPDFRRVARTFGRVSGESPSLAVRQKPVCLINVREGDGPLNGPWLRKGNVSVQWPMVY